MSQKNWQTKQKYQKMMPIIFSFGSVLSVSCVDGGNPTNRTEAAKEVSEDITEYEDIESDICTGGMLTMAT